MSNPFTDQQLLHFLCGLRNDRCVFPVLDSIGKSSKVVNTILIAGSRNTIACAAARCQLIGNVGLGDFLHRGAIGRYHADQTIMGCRGGSGPGVPDL